MGKNHVGLLSEAKQILGESIQAGAKVGDVIAGDGRSSLGSRLEASAVKDIKKVLVFQF